jgi:hypothetical protein
MHVYNKYTLKMGIYFTQLLTDGGTVAKNGLLHAVPVASLEMYAA